MMRFWKRGAVLEQYKEPAASRELKKFSENIVKSRRIIPAQSLENLSPEEILEVAKKAEIVDEIDKKPLAQKLLKARSSGCETVAADAVDDDPYLSSRLNLLLHCRKEVASGLRLAAKAVLAGNAIIAVYRNLTDLDTRLPRKVEGIRVKRLGGAYPAAAALYREAEQNKTVYVGTGALLHLHRAVFEAQMQTTVFLTVAGNCIANPANLEVPLGMPLLRVLEFCGLSANPNTVILGGAMTGVSVLDCERTFVSHGDRGLLAFRDPKYSPRYTCVGCGRCIDVCPKGLPVFYMYRAAEQSLSKAGTRVWAQREYPYDQCIQCGACAYVCPSKLEIPTVLRSFRERNRGDRQREMQSLLTSVQAQMQDVVDQYQEPAPNLENVEKSEKLEFSIEDSFVDFLNQIQEQELLPDNPHEDGEGQEEVPTETEPKTETKIEKERKEGASPAKGRKKRKDRKDFRGAALDQEKQAVHGQEEKPVDSAEKAEVPSSAPASEEAKETEIEQQSVPEEVIPLPREDWMERAPEKALPEKKSGKKSSGRRKNSAKGGGK